MTAQIAMPSRVEAGPDLVTPGPDRMLFAQGYMCAPGSAEPTPRAYMCARGGYCARASVFTSCPAGASIDCHRFRVRIAT